MCLVNCVRCLNLNLDGIKANNPLLQRLASLNSTVRKAKREKRSTWYKTIFRLNVFPGEFACDLSDFVFDENEDRDVYHLKNKVSDLEEALVRSNKALAGCQQAVNEREAANLVLADRNAFLTSHMAAVERDSQANLVQMEQLKTQVNDFQEQRCAVFSRDAATP